MSGPLSLRLCCLSAMAPALTEAATQARAKLTSISPADGLVAGREGPSPPGSPALQPASTDTQIIKHKPGLSIIRQGLAQNPIKVNGKPGSENPLSIIKGMSFTASNGLSVKGGNGKMPQTVGQIKGPLLPNSKMPDKDPSQDTSVLPPDPIIDPEIDDNIQEITDNLTAEPQPGSSGMSEVGVLTNADLSAEVGRKQRELERKADRLLRRMRRLQSRQLVSHVKQQLNGLVDHQHRNLQTMAKSMKSPPSNVDMRTELLQSEDVKSLSTAALVSLVQRLQSSQQLSLRQRLTNGSPNDPNTSILKLDENLCTEMNRTSSTMQMQLKHLQNAIDSDATESSSGGESCDEADYYDDDKSQRVSIERRAEWRWSMERAAIAARWTWLQAQVSDLEYRIRQQTDIYKQIRAAKGVVVLGDPPAPQDLLNRQPNRQGKRLTPLEEKIAMIERKNTEMSPCNLSTLLSNVDKQSSKLTQQLGSVYTPTGSPQIKSQTSTPKTPTSNGLIDTQEGDELSRVSTSLQFEPASPVVDNTCQAARCRPVRSYGKRKLLRTAGLYQVSRKAARLSTVKCHCHPPDVMPCVMCGGRYNNTMNIDPETIPLSERVAMLDSSYHPVLSFTQDVPLPVHFEALLKSGDWQHKPPPKLLRPTASDRKRSNKTINDHVRRYNRKLSKSASAAMLSSAKIKNKYDQKTLSWSHNGALPTTPIREKRPYVRQAGYRLKRRDGMSGMDGLNKRRRSMSQTLQGTPLGDGWTLSSSASSATLRDMKDREMKRRRGESAFDINNIVIPYSMAASTRVEKLQYKEIITPKWREVDEESDSSSQEVKKPPPAPPVVDKVNHGPTPGSNGIVISLPQSDDEEEDENEDISDDQYIARHLRCEMFERKRFLPAANQLRRGRGNRTDSTMSLCTMDSMDGESSFSGIQTPPTTPASASKVEEATPSCAPTNPVTPANPVTPVNLATPANPPTPQIGGFVEEGRQRSGSCSSRDGMRSRSQSVSRCRTMSMAEDNIRPEMEMIRTYLPWSPRQFPLNEDDYEKLHCDNPVSVEQVQKVTFHTATPEDSNPNSPMASSTSSDIIEQDDPNDPEWSVIGNQRVSKASTSNIVLKLAKR